MSPYTYARWTCRVRDNQTPEGCDNDRTFLMTAVTIWFWPIACCRREESVSVMLAAIYFVSYTNQNCDFHVRSIIVPGVRSGLDSISLDTGAKYSDRISPLLKMKKHVPYPKHIIIVLISYFIKIKNNNEYNNY